MGIFLASWIASRLREETLKNEADEVSCDHV